MVERDQIANKRFASLLHALTIGTDYQGSSLAYDFEHGKASFGREANITVRDITELSLHFGIIYGRLITIPVFIPMYPYHLAWSLGDESVFNRDNLQHKSSLFGSSAVIPNHVACFHALIIGTIGCKVNPPT